MASTRDKFSVESAIEMISASEAALMETVSRDIDASPKENVDPVMDSAPSSVAVIDPACSCAIFTLCFALPRWFWYAFSLKYVR